VLSSCIRYRECVYAGFCITRASGGAEVWFLTDTHFGAVANLGVLSGPPTIVRQARLSSALPLGANGRVGVGGRTRRVPRSHSGHDGISSDFRFEPSLTPGRVNPHSLDSLSQFQIP
jgi:hypothetical protein